MKNLTKVVSSILAVGVLFTTGVTALAASDIEAGNNKNQVKTAITQKFSNKESMKRGKGGLGNMARPELTEEKKAEMVENMKERLAQRLKDGQITQEHYDAVMKDIEEGKKPMFLGQNKGKGGFGNKERTELTEEKKAEMVENMKERLAQRLKDGQITQEHYDTVMKDIKEGKKPMFLGKHRGQGNNGVCNMDDQK